MTKDMEESINDSNTSERISYGKVLRCANQDGSENNKGEGNSRQIGYTFVPCSSEDCQDTAVVYFYMLSASSIMIDYLAPALIAGKGNEKCGFLCVDRPGCGSTSAQSLWTATEDGRTTPKIERAETRADNDVVSMERIKIHVDHVIQVLRHERITKVYVLGACLGHVYAVQLCRELLQEHPASDEGTNQQRRQQPIVPQVQALSLVAPFVSTACPTAWWFARFGASSMLPFSILRGFSETSASWGAYLSAKMISPSRIKSILKDDEAQDWTEDDLKEACQLIIDMNQASTHAKAAETLLGTSALWQEQVCDAFAAECRMLVLEEEDGHLDQGSDDHVDTDSSPPFPISIYASPEDALATYESVEWIAKRCYGFNYGWTVVSSSTPKHDTQLIQQHTLHSHGTMILWGGPLRNPKLLWRVLKAWCLISEIPPDTLPITTAKEYDLDYDIQKQQGGCRLGRLVCGTEG